jgi:hypothetical protein
LIHTKIRCKILMRRKTELKKFCKKIYEKRFYREATS